MRFVTVLKPKQSEYRRRVQWGGRGFYFGDFAYELTDDRAAEGISVRFGPNLFRCIPRTLGPEVEAGVRLGYEGALRSGVRLCSIGFTMTFAKYHDLETTPHAVHVNVSLCVRDYLVREAEPVPSLHEEWLTPDVVALARGIGAGAALDGIPALHDALLEAGCDDPLVMEHLRACPDHSPSCWVVEMILAQAAARG
jgi:hypothetical protein